MTITLETVYTLLQKGGLTVVVIILGYLTRELIKGELIGRRMHDEIVKNLRDQIETNREEYKVQLEETKEECAFFRQIAFRTTDMAERAVKTVAPEVMEKVEKLK